MTNTYKPHLDQQPRPDDGRKKQQALETDREKPSSELVDFAEHDNRLGGDPDSPRRKGQKQSQTQSQTQSQSADGQRQTGN